MRKVITRKLPSACWAPSLPAVGDSDAKRLQPCNDIILALCSHDLSMATHSAASSRYMSRYAFVCKLSTLQQHQLRERSNLTVSVEQDKNSLRAATELKNVVQGRVWLRIQPNRYTPLLCCTYHAPAQLTQLQLQLGHALLLTATDM